MRRLMLIAGLSLALLSTAADAQQDDATRPGTLNTVQTLGTMRETTGGAHGTGSKLGWQQEPVKEKSLSAPLAPSDKKPGALADSAGRTIDARILAPVPSDPVDAVAASQAQEYKATGSPLVLAPFSMAARRQVKEKR